MDATGWKGGTLGVRVGKENAARYFDRAWKIVHIDIGGNIRAFPLTPGFWSDCPEIRGIAIQEWMERQGLAPWPKGRPPKLELIPLGGSHFRLKRK
jgi:hypothetical protein